MISKIEEIAELNDEIIKSVLAYVEPEKLTKVIDICENQAVKNKILNNLSDETKKKIQTHTRAFDQTSYNAEEIKNNFLAIVNRVLNFR